MDQWWDQDEQVVAHWPVHALDRQHDPAEMIAAMIDVIEAEHPPYPHRSPAGTEAMLRKEQEEIWSIRV